MGIRVAALVLALAMIAVLPGCSRRQEADADNPPPQPGDLEPVKDPSIKGARSAIEQCLDARVSGDYARVYQLLSAGSRKAYNAAYLADYFESWLMQNGAQRAVDSMLLSILAAPDGLKPRVARLVADLFQYSGEHETAVPLYQFVVQEIPQYSNWCAGIFVADTRRFLAESLVATGRPDEALVQILGAQILDPFHMANHALRASQSSG